MLLFFSGVKPYMLVEECGGKELWKSDVDLLGREMSAD
jgi:hypothetical protein